MISKSYLKKSLEPTDSNQRFLEKQTAFNDELDVNNSEEPEELEENDTFETNTELVEKPSRKSKITHEFKDFENWIKNQ